MNAPQMLPWQQEAWRRLLSATMQERLPHAWLLAGSAGTGLESFAAAMTRHLLCEGGVAGGCGDCAGCTLLEAGHHPDRIFLRPEEDKTQITVEALREAMQRLELASSRGRRRVLIIEPAEALNDSGANALLKTLEEPAPATHLLLLTYRVQALKATIRSRCQILRPGRPTAAQGRDWLRQHRPELGAELVERFAQAPLALTEQESWTDFDGRALRGGLAAAMKLVAAFDKPQAAACLRWLMHEAARELAARLGAGGSAQPPFSKLSVERLSDWMESLRAAHRQVLDGGTTPPRLLLESLMIDLYDTASAKT